MAAPTAAPALAGPPRDPILRRHISNPDVLTLAAPSEPFDVGKTVNISSFAMSLRLIFFPAIMYSFSLRASHMLNSSSQRATKTQILLVVLQLKKHRHCLFIVLLQKGNLS
jgi:hypothetical protein